MAAVRAVAHACAGPPEERAVTTVDGWVLFARLELAFAAVPTAAAIAGAAPFTKDTRFVMFRHVGATTERPTPTDAATTRASARAAP